MYGLGSKGWPDPFVMTLFHECSLASVPAAGSGGNTSSGAWPAVSFILYYPFFIRSPKTYVVAFWMNGAAVSGDLDMGLYNADGTTKLFSLGSTAQAGVNAVQQATVSWGPLDPGRYYWAMVADNTTATFHRVGPSTTHMRCAGVRQQASTFPLPASATFAAPTATFMPAIGLSELATI